MAKKTIRRSYGTAGNCDYLHELSYKWVAGWIGLPELAMDADENTLEMIEREYARRGWNGFRFELV
ncbi:MAG: hypothetical protein JW713_06485 [Pontiellaceae bacterium]|nr:hypothetical protein [Pontiellaceae bacterium]